MKQSANLSSLREGERCCIEELKLNGRMRSRLRDLGLIEGAYVECLHRSASGDPAAYLICGAVIALRNEDTSRITIEKTAVTH